MTTRREFVGTAAALLLPRQAPPKLPLGFSTLGCPKWPWPKILDFAAEHQFAAVELRGILENMDLTKVPELAPERIGDAKRQLAAHGLSVSCLGASAQMHDMDPAKHAAQLDEARRFIDLAHALGAPYVRVFGNEYVPGVPRDQMLAHIGGALHELGDYARGKDVTVIIESHGAFTDSPSPSSHASSSPSRPTGIPARASPPRCRGSRRTACTARCSACGGAARPARTRPSCRRSRRRSAEYIGNRAMRPS